MDLNKLWVGDPSKDNTPSVSLTLLVLSVGLLILGSSLEMAGIVHTLSALPELTYSSIALYFGRRMTISGKSFNSDKAQEVAEKASE